MTSTNGTTIQETVSADDLKRLAKKTGVCLSFLLPDQSPGTSTATHSSVLRQMAREARNTSGESMDAIDVLVDDDRLKENGPGLAIFATAGEVECFRLPGTIEAKLSIGSHFNLTPLVQLALVPRQMFILGLSRQHMRLLRYDGGVVTGVEWPDGVADSLDEADHGRVEAVGNHSSVSMGAGGMSSTQFGSTTRPDREGAGHHITHFLQLVDSGVAPILGGAPLLLGGVAEEIAAFRRASKYLAILTPEIDGSIEHMRVSELAKRAEEIAREVYFAEGAKAVEGCRAGKSPLKDPEAILQAATEGRVHRLCVREQTADDLVNAAVAETLRTGGEVFIVRSQDMADDTAIAALRY